MPIRIDSSGGDTPPVKPGTNGHELLTVLLDHPDMGFSPKELTELTDVPHSSVHKTLSRLQEKGLVRKVDSYWAVAEDVAASEVANAVSLQQIEAEYGDDAYGDDDEWADEAPDLGENA
ncbi:MarR family transcriptional regulator [Haloarcula sp. CBA1130]|uniref:MarR family transcriptional regulator n=1 Tax=unclassified Haloarcula TaxID=2624677 RepID=UPI0012442AA0|nr:MULTISPECIES: helix-turn-helix domain-containing protein [unclassified Haloarcula]KAA9396562.1 MarR family transcriptional regulator [Haloarcula sp. CBA1130]KAA9397579.1 MarR family transcriptional regulator [Haloarcula sp. CBA1129]